MCVGLHLRHCDNWKSEPYGIVYVIGMFIACKAINVCNMCCAAALGVRDTAAEACVRSNGPKPIRQHSVELQTSISEDYQICCQLVDKSVQQIRNSCRYCVIFTLDFLLCCHHKTSSTRLVTITLYTFSASKGNFWANDRPSPYYRRVEGYRQRVGRAFISACFLFCCSCVGWLICLPSQSCAVSPT
jgi:hypothetical protein